MTYQRRAFLKTILGVSAGIMLPKLASASINSRLIGSDEDFATPTHGTAIQPSPADPLAQASYLSLLNTRFQIQSPEKGSVPVRLVEILAPEPNALHRAPNATEQFSLLFEGSPTTLLSQDTYSLFHPALGTFELFLVPVGDPTRTVHYQAIIHRH